MRKSEPKAELIYESRIIKQEFNDMARLYRREVAGAALRCYSERGLMSYFMFHVLPQRMEDFTAKIEFAEGSPKRFQGIQQFDGLYPFGDPQG